MQYTLEARRRSGARFYNYVQKIDPDSIDNAANEARTDPDTRLQDMLVAEQSKNNSNSPLLGYYDIDHYKGRLFLHVWSDKNVVAVTSKDITFNTTEDYMVMILRFPFAAKGQYFATPSSFIDAGFDSMEYVDNIDRLAELDLD